MDEARHVEVFRRFILEKLGHEYPVNAELKKLLDQILGDSRWDIKCLGMQIIVEGLALAAFGTLRDTTTNPLLRNLITYVMEDEARHVAYGGAVVCASIAPITPTQNEPSARNSSTKRAC